MPELQGPKDHPHPWGAYRRRLDGGGAAAPREIDRRGAYAELQVTSNFSFLRGGSHPDELVAAAAELGLQAVAITDRGTLAGIVRAHVAAKQHGVQLIVGATVDLALDARQLGEDPTPAAPPLTVLLHPTDRASYGRLSRLLTLGKRRAAKGACHLAVHDLIEHQAGLLATIVPPTGDGAIDQPFIEAIEGLRRVFDDDRLSLAMTRRFDLEDGPRLARLAALSTHVGVPLVATNDVRYHAPGRRMLQDVVTCIRLGRTLETAGLDLEANAERYLKPADEMARLFADYPEAIERTLALAARARGFNLDQLQYEYPREVCPPNTTPMTYLEQLVWQGAAERYGGQKDAPSLPASIFAQLNHELDLIRELGYAEYFLTVYDLVVYARSRGILCQGRGAAANSAVCYCLGVTSVDPARIDVLFERFLSKARNEPPDIDIDFEHERREEVIQYIYQKYGRDRAALCAEVISYRPRSAIRDVGKALGLSLDCVDRLAKQIDGWHKGSIDPDQLRQLGYDPDEPTMQHLIRLTAEILGFPRHLSQHVGGFVMTDQPLSELVPIENAAMEDRTVIEWDKDDIDAMGMLKVDCLGLGMLTCLNKAWRLLVGIGAELEQDTEARNHEDAKKSREKRDVCMTDTWGGGTTSERATRVNDRDVRGSRGVAESTGSGASGISGDASDADVRIGETVQTGCEAEQDHKQSRSAPPDERNRAGVDGAAPKHRADSEALTLERRAVPSLSSCVRAPGPAPAPLDLSAIPAEDPAVYDMIGRADTVGVFQIESRAQMSMLPRLRPRCYYDLVIEVAIVRPGPIVGDMVHPYLRRRNGEEPVTYPDETVKRILGKTLGVPLFQEQAMRMAIDCAGFTPEEADQLRRAIAAWKSKQKVIYAFGCKLIDGMVAHGLDRSFAERCFEQIKGFSEYGFPESHAASFALIVYASAWLKCHHPAAFAAALINSQPMGFYAPAQIVRDAREHGVEVRPIDVNHSGWDCSLEQGDSSCSGPAMRLGMRLVRGLAERDARAIAAAVGAQGPFGCMEALWRASGVGIAAIRRLAAADAFGSMGLARREALWRARALRDERLPLFEMSGTGEGPRASEDARSPGQSAPRGLPGLSIERAVLQDYATTGLSLKRHPVSFLRRKLGAMGATRCGELRDARAWPHGRQVGVAGVVLVRQRPSTASGVVFMTIEDETGVANLIFRPEVFERFRRAARHGICLLVRGRVERQGEVVHVNVRKVIDLTHELDGLRRTSRDFH